MLTIENIPQRFFKEIASKIEFGNSVKNECWIWNGAKNNNGYGFIRYKNSLQLVHRIMYSWFIKPIPRGLSSKGQVDHMCNNRLCCNPKHLQFITQKENVLRGKGVSAVNARKIFCKRGHKLPLKDNRSDGGRRCLICQRQKDREYWKKRKDNYVHSKSIKPSNDL